MVKKTYRMSRQDCWRWWAQDPVDQFVLATAKHFAQQVLNLAGLQYLRGDHFRKYHRSLFGRNLVVKLTVWASRNQGRSLAVDGTCQNRISLDHCY